MANVYLVLYILKKATYYLDSLEIIGKKEGGASVNRPQKTEEPGKEVSDSPKESLVQFDTGNLSREEIEAVFNALPVDITFVDKNDTVRYFSQTKGRIFARSKAVVGRKVQQCHPQKSVHIVNQILQAFKNGNRDVAEFWIDLQGKLVFIRYLPVRDKNGNYLGCLEVAQDITNIKKIEGERRLLDWT